MRKGSRKRSNKNAGKSRQLFEPPIERTAVLAQRFDLPPLERNDPWIIEGNKALAALLARNKGYQYAARSSLLTGPRQRPGVDFKGRRRPAPSTLPNPAKVIRGVAGLALDLLPSPVKKVRDALICAKRTVRRELVFASGGAGSRRTVPQRAAPSKVRC